MNNPARGPNHGHRSRRIRLWALAGISLALLLVTGSRLTGVARADNAPFREGDIFASSWGSVAHLSPQFGQVDTVTSGEGECACGLAFDPDGNLDVATGGSVIQIASDGSYQGVLFSSSGANALTIDGDGDFFVGNNSSAVKEYDDTGTLQHTFTVDTSDGASTIASLALLEDGCTLLYTDYGTAVHTYDVCLDDQLTDFVTGLDLANGVALLAGGDVLVADLDVIHKFDDGGDETQYYGTPSSGVVWKGVAVSGDGESLISQNQDDADLHSFDLSTGDETDLGGFNVPTESPDSGNDVVVYTGPTVLPPETISYYVQDIDNDVLTDSESLPYEWGCAIRGAGFSSGAVILDFGQAFSEEDPFIPATTDYGANLLDTNDFVTTADIRVAVDRFVEGFTNAGCGPTPGSALNLIIGTNNYGNGLAGTSYTTYPHGVAWADLVNDVNSDLTTAEVDDAVHAFGGIDAEVDWNYPGNTTNWASGYASEAGSAYFDFGDAAGCPATGTTSSADDCDTPHAYGWTEDDVFTMAWGNPEAYPLPEVYLRVAETPNNSQQWHRISAYGLLNSFSAAGFAGTLTQSLACSQRPLDCSSGVDDITSDVAFPQLWDALASDETAVYLYWRTDLSWGWGDGPE